MGGILIKVIYLHFFKKNYLCDKNGDFLHPRGRSRCLYAKSFYKNKIKNKMKNIFDSSIVSEVVQRINNLKPNSKGLWGKMTVAQMLAHCNVAYEMVYTDKHPKPGAFKTWMLKLFVKSAVVGPKPYPKNGRTAPEFIVNTERNFEKEKKRLIDFIQKTQKLGEAYFDNKESHSFGALTKEEWSTMFYKHIDHHLVQFGV